MNSVEARVERHQQDNIQKISKILGCKFEHAATVEGCKMNSARIRNYFLAGNLFEVIVSHALETKMLEKENFHLPLKENRLFHFVLDDEELADREDKTWILEILENFGVQLRRDDVREKLPSENSE